MGCQTGNIIELVDNHPDSYWLINLENYRRIRRSKHDIEIRIPIESTNTNVMSTPIYQPTLENILLYSPLVTSPIMPEEPKEHTPPTASYNPPIRQTQQKPDQHCKTTSPAKTQQNKTKTRSGRVSKQKREPNFVYN